MAGSRVLIDAFLLREQRRNRLAKSHETPKPAREAFAESKKATAAGGGEGEEIPIGGKQKPDAGTKLEPSNSRLREESIAKPPPPKRRKPSQRPGEVPVEGPLAPDSNVICTCNGLWYQGTLQTLLPAQPQP